MAKKKNLILPCFAPVIIQYRRIQILKVIAITLLLSLLLLPISIFTDTAIINIGRIESVSVNSFN